MSAIKEQNLGGQLKTGRNQKCTSLQSGLKLMPSPITRFCL